MFNPMERIRKLSGMPDMKRGYPPATHRKCSDWASYVDAVDTVTRELVDALLTCQNGAMQIAKDKAIYAGKLAEQSENKAAVEKKRIAASVDNKGLQLGLDPGAREEFAEAVEGKA